MEPSFQEGDYLLIDQLSYRFSSPERGDTIVFRYPRDPSRRYIKRIIGLPGETLVIEDGNIYVTNDDKKEKLEEDYILESETFLGMSVSLEEDEFFVIGDNRGASFDSREWGSLSSDYIIGKVFFRVAPFEKVFARVEAPSY